MAEANELVEALAECREDDVLAMIRQRIEDQVPVGEIVTECNRGMAELGERFAREQCFLPELMFGGMIMKHVMRELAPLMKQQDETESIGVVVIGSVRHDVHDVGKDIVAMMLRGIGFEVVDLGVDVPPEKFVEAVREHQPAVLGMSVLLTTCFKSVSATVEALQEAGLRDSLKLMVGGAAASDLMAKGTGCDYYGKTAVDGVKFACQAAGVG